MSDQKKPHFAYIECVRGYAILLVILCHATYLFPGLPYSVRRVTVLGWHGVQLFFLASAVTLMMAWQYEKARDGSVNVAAFFLRRFFRIAPGFYLASVLYFLLEPPEGGFDPMQAAATYLFINAWHPTLMGVTLHGWSVVPGSWSIGVEFTFYLMFPLLASIITSLARAICSCLCAVIVGATVNALLWPSLQAEIGIVPADNFLYFWFPNQMSVFALGLCLFYLLERRPMRHSFLAAYPNSVAAGSLGLVVATAFIRIPHWLDLRQALPPKFLLVSLALMIFVLALARCRAGVFVNAPIALLGRVSFSAYLLHAALIKVISDQPYLRGYFHISGRSAIVTFALAMVSIVLITLAGSWCTYRLIEVPMIRIGKTLIGQRGAAVHQGV